MNSRSLTAATLLGAAALLLAPSPARAQDRMYQILRSGSYAGVVGDYFQVKFFASSTPGDTGELKVSVHGDGVQKVAVFGGAIPGRPMLPGGKYYLIALFRCERRGAATVRIDEVANATGQVVDTTNLSFTVSDVGR